MNANEMRKLKEQNKPTERFEALDSILHVIKEMATNGLETLITPHVYDLQEAQRLTESLTEMGYQVTHLKGSLGVALQVDWS